MSTSKYGAQDWKEPVQDPTKQQGKDFLRLKPGSNILRLLTLPHLYNQHRWEPEGGRKYGYRINCSRSETEGNCPLCDTANKAKKRWYVGVIDRDSGTYKILDIGYSVFKSIQTLAKGQWGSPENYDVDIVVDPQGGATGYYYVSPMPPKPLSAADIALKEDGAAMNDLEARCKPQTPAQVQEKMAKIREEIENGGQEMAPASRQQQSRQAPRQSEAPRRDEPAPQQEEDGDEDFFSTYKKKTA